MRLSAASVGMAIFCYGYWNSELGDETVRRLGRDDDLLLWVLGQRAERCENTIL
jgi:hypothetical protein